MVPWWNSLCVLDLHDAHFLPFVFLLVVSWCVNLNSSFLASACCYHTKKIKKWTNNIKKRKKEQKETPWMTDPCSENWNMGVPTKISKHAITAILPQCLTFLPQLDKNGGMSCVKILCACVCMQAWMNACVCGREREWKRESERCDWGCFLTRRPIVCGFL